MQTSNQPTKEPPNQLVIYLTTNPTKLINLKFTTLNKFVPAVFPLPSAAVELALLKI